MDKQFQQLNIAMFGHKRIPSREGGIEIVVEELSTRMVLLGNHVTCYNRSGHHVAGKMFDAERRAEYKGVQIKNLLTIHKRGLAAVTSSFWGAIITAFGSYDVVHIHAEGPAFMCWLPKLLGKKIVVTIHGLDHQRAKWGKLARTYIMMGEKNAVRYADEIIVLSTGIQEYFQMHYGRNTVFIPNGIKRPNILKAHRITKKWGLKKDTYILYVGRLVPEKGLDYLINAFKLTKTDKKLVIAGGSSDSTEFMENLKILAKNDLRILFTGFVQGDILEELYSNAYIYILPSDLEGMPLSLLEGMSYGNCCLTSDIKECSDVVENKAILFKKGNIEDLRNKIQMLCDDKRMVQSYKMIAADFICSKYNWDDVVNKTIQVYKKI